MRLDSPKKINSKKFRRLKRKSKNAKKTKTKQKGLENIGEKRE